MNSSYRDALDVAWWYTEQVLLEDGTIPELVGRGEDRCAYRIGDVVYKVGQRDTANPYDHEGQEEVRRRGCRWAPAWSELHEIEGFYGDLIPVLAMPYYADDDNRADPVLYAEMQAQASAGDQHCDRDDCHCRHSVDATNYIVLPDGQPIVIDFCTVRMGLNPRNKRTAPRSG